MPRRKNKFFAILKRREQVAAMYLDGKSVRLIAAELSCSIGSVSSDLNAIKNEWMKKTQESILKLRAEALAKLNNVERLAYIAFEESQGEQVVTTNRARNNPRTGAVEVTKQEVKHFSPGDPRYLEVISKCLNARIHLLGLAEHNRGESYDHLPVIGFEVVEPTNYEKNEMDEMN
jgi:DNA-binding CsgD family transcriptional regulator